MRAAADFEPALSDMATAPAAARLLGQVLGRHNKQSEAAGGRKGEERGREAVLRFRGAKRVHKRRFKLRGTRCVSCCGEKRPADSMRYRRHPHHKRRDELRAARRPPGPDSANRRLLHG